MKSYCTKWFFYLAWSSHMYFSDCGIGKFHVLLRFLYKRLPHSLMFILFIYLFSWTWSTHKCIKTHLCALHTYYQISRTTFKIPIQQHCCIQLFFPPIGMKHAYMCFSNHGITELHVLFRLLHNKDAASSINSISSMTALSI